MDGVSTLVHSGGCGIRSPNAINHVIHMSFLYNVIFYPIAFAHRHEKKDGTDISLYTASRQRGDRAGGGGDATHEYNVHIPLFSSENSDRLQTSLSGP